MKRAVVLGGGGSVGVAWEVGITAGLLDAGVDLRDADLIVGTSAGAYVGAQLAHGADALQLLRTMREAEPMTSNPQREYDAAGAAAVFQHWGNAELERDDRCVKVGRAALAAKTAPEAEVLARYEVEIPAAWPAKPLLVTAVDATTGAFRTMDASDGVALRPAVAASCAVPGLFPPVTIGEGRYMDGGVRSMTSADLAQRIEPDIVLIVAVFGFLDRGLHHIAARDLAAEAAALEAAGVSVRIIRFDDAAQAASGGNLMDASARLATAGAGEAHGRALGAPLRSWWDGGEASARSA